MHKVVVPKLSGVHRFACLALYRALLRQCTRLPNATPELNASKPLIKQKFHRYKSLQSPSQTVNAMKAGYEALDLLHNASQGKKRDVSHITKLITHSQSMKEESRLAQRKMGLIKNSKPVSPKVQKKEESRRLQQNTARRHPDATSILSRPRPVVSGRRQIPVLVNARGVPFLRIKKPQPKNLSGVLRTKLEKRWSKIERRERLQLELLFAKDEDLWDRLTIDQEPDTWSQEVLTALKDVNTKIKETDNKNKELAEAMWKVVLAERELAAKEKEEKDVSPV
ncbi:hypothetical protein ASPWEDRAFT_102093 [Aspergillus wentii DTO 134E9]|uniref:Complex 1 LYR protein domain-containing protein n=1 Tax=Aspergillus wentii DTO 134E9 TaxID=1073089 RepID=A0A1L9S041_ASPWE|nr:uncharacterized protein ASPWEDRAFT_102093 [Aspergillus wentii DTO 134E9]OJJ40524.1 hypothetical protein ASPWEDRAFT_102093 [Aspergillus wentii DTO 134E9]